MGLGPAETYVDFIEKLVQEKLLPPDFGEKLKEYVRLRNVLVHRYLYINHKTLYGKCKDLVEELVPRFEAFIRKILEA